MGPKTAFRGLITQALIGLLIAALAFGVIRQFFPNLLLPVTSQSTLLEIKPSSAFRCTARKGDVVEATFVVRNVSRSDVRVLGLRTTCACTSVDTEFPIRLRSGAVAEIKVKLTVGDPDPDGQFKKSADLFVDREGKVPSLNLVATVTGSAPSI